MKLWVAKIEPVEGLAVVVVPALLTVRVAQPSLGWIAELPLPSPAYFASILMTETLPGLRTTPLHAPVLFVVVEPRATVPPLQLAFVFDWNEIVRPDSAGPLAGESWPLDPTV